MDRSSASADAITALRQQRSDSDALLGAVVAARRAAALLPALLLFLVGMAFCSIAAYMLWQSGARLALIPVGFAGACLFAIPITAWR